MDTADPLLLLWGKTGKHPGEYHPLLCHLLDVAAVARLLWQEVLPPAATEGLAMALGLPPPHAAPWVAFLAGLHDLGKASPAFAFSDDFQRARLAAAGFGAPSPLPHTGHGVVTAAVLPDLLHEFGLPEPLARRFAAAVGGHHGVLPGGATVLAAPAEAGGGTRWQRARRDLARRLAALLDVPLADPPRALPNAQALLLAGLAAVADWIGSAAEFFAYAVADDASSSLDVEQYARGVHAKARDALTRLAWLGWRPPAGPADFGRLFPGLTPRPLQAAAIALAAELAPPALVLVEAPTGEGKTEAAMYLADAWAAAHGQRGCYFALPTQATSDQMFSRVGRFLARRYPAEVVNLQLLHGHAALAAEFQALRRSADHLFTPAGVHQPAAHDGAPGGVVAAEWFTHRKRGLLAPFGVGTVDQALLAALQTRHVFVRLFGLAHKVVVVDEVHAYDTYMTRLLERLLEWLAACGTSVVLLSATLPAAKRDDLLRAYQRGLLGEAPPTPLPHVPYPALAALDRRGVAVRPVGVSPLNARRVALSWVDGRLPDPGQEDFPLGRRLNEALAEGGCAAVICNTVARAQEVYRALAPYFAGLADDGLPELDLLHARFLYEERERRELRARRRFGSPAAQVIAPDGTAEPVRRPRRAVLVATQIVEQSLDLDFDLLVTDPAPVDLVLQRMGRLHRHRRPRPAGLDAPTLWLCLPLAGADGVPTFDPGTAAVYDAHVLLRSWLALRDRGAITIPDDVRSLVEAVYDDRPCPPTAGPALRRRWEETRLKAQRRAEADEAEARDRWLKRPNFDGALWRFTEDTREEDAPDFHPAHQALTRLAEPTVQVVCLYGPAQRPSLDPEGRETVDLSRKPDVPLATTLLRRSLAVADRRVVGRLFQAQAPASWRKSPLLRHHRLLLLDREGSTPVGDCRLTLDPKVGLVITGPSKEVPCAQL